MDLLPHVSPNHMIALGRVLLWTVALVAPGGFLLVPVLAAASLHPRKVGTQPNWVARFGAPRAAILRGWSALQRYWTKS